MFDSKTCRCSDARGGFLCQTKPNLVNVTLEVAPELLAFVKVTAKIDISRRRRLQATQSSYMGVASWPALSINWVVATTTKTRPSL